MDIAHTHSHSLPYTATTVGENSAKFKGSKIADWNTRPNTRSGIEYLHDDSELAIMSSSSQTEEIPEMSMDSLLSVVESFFRGITLEQFENLKLGKPDDATKITLAQILLDLVLLMTKSIPAVCPHSNTFVSLLCLHGVQWVLLRVLRFSPRSLKTMQLKLNSFLLH